MVEPYPQVRRLRSAAALRERLELLDSAMPVAEQVDPAGPLARDHDVAGLHLPNRFAVLPMEGWDGTADGRPSELVRRRWQRFGASGAGLVWGGEAVAVRADGRANARQLSIGPNSVADLAGLRTALTDAHRVASGGGAPPVVGLQLTHSGRWARLGGEPAPRIAARHPLLDVRVGADDAAVLSDGELDDLVGDFVHSATVAAEAGFDFVDVKHCHGYLLHELLAAPDRPGPYGGSFEGRTRFLREVVAGIRTAAPGLRIGVRLSVYDVVPHVIGPDGIGVPAAAGPYGWAFGGDVTGTGIDLTEPHRFADLLDDLGIALVCVTAGSPYWCPHVQRPAYFPPSDGYLPPRDPLVDVAVMQQATRSLAAAHPALTVVGSGLTYLQEHVAAVSQGLVEGGWMDLVGLGRMMLSQPELPRRILNGEPAERRTICRTFSDCTTAPRQGLVSGCYPLDDFYKQHPDRPVLVAAKRAAVSDRGGRRAPSSDADR